MILKTALLASSFCLCAVAFAAGGDSGNGTAIAGVEHGHKVASNLSGDKGGGATLSSGGVSTGGGGYAPVAGGFERGGDAASSSEGGGGNMIVAGGKGSSAGDGAA